MLLAGNSSQGPVLPGQVQGVTAGSGVQINGNGVLSINGSDPTFNGFIKTNNNLAFNNYVWPGIVGTVGQQLTVVNAAGDLGWTDADGIPWTQKGQLVAATGPDPAPSGLVNVGANTAFLIANSSTPTGLAYTDTSVTAALLPTGLTNDRPVGPLVGQLRYNETNSEFEGYQGAIPAWSYLSSMPTGPVTAATGATNKIFYQNEQIVTANYTVGSTTNAMSSGPITLAGGVVVTIAAGGNWAIV
jgi:hypothetical protein